MSTRLLLLFFSVFFLLAGRQSPVLGQAGNIATEAQNGSYQLFSLTDLGIFRQARFQSVVNLSAGSSTWAYVEADGNYTPNWRPYFSGLTLAGYDQTIAPIGGTASATYNSGYGSFWGDDGLMPAVTSGNYYTFNITEYSKPGDTVNEYMGVLETSYDPVSFTALTQSPVSGIDRSTYVTITVSLSDMPSAGEYLYLRYAPTYNFTGSNFLDMYVSGLTASATIPCQDQDSIYYYVYSSNRTKPQIATEVTAHGQVAHDMLTLNLINNGGPNYFYTILPVNSCDILPVTWLDFTAEAYEQTVGLNWWTSSESNSDHFKVQRSTDGSDWEDIGQVLAAGQSFQTIPYSYTDDAPLSGRSYYRLLQVDQDGTSDASEIRQVFFQIQDQIHIFPNPSSGTFHISMQGMQGEQAYCLITDMAGKTVYAERFFPDGMMTNKTLNTGLPDGVYQVIITAGQLDICRQQLVIQR